MQGLFIKLRNKNLNNLNWAFVIFSFFKTYKSRLFKTQFYSPARKASVEHIPLPSTTVS